MSEFEQTEELEDKYEGCYGQHVNHDELSEFVDDILLMNSMNPSEKHAVCIYGWPGVGKTAFAKQLANKPVEYKGEKYDGYQIHYVPLANFEEMGDILGMPDRHFKVTREHKEGDVETKWVVKEVLENYEKQGWVLDTDAEPRSKSVIPDWIPTEDVPSILIFDDWTRADKRILNGVMQIIQEGKTSSWELPEACTIICTANPSGQQFLVSEIDGAMKTRIDSVTLIEDEKVWAKWAEENGVDSRGISMVLKYPEIMTGEERTNLRTLTSFFDILKTVPSGVVKDAKHVKRVTRMAESKLDSSTVGTVMGFLQTDLEDLVEIEEIFEGSQFALDKVKDLMTRKEVRIDMISILVERVFNKILVSKESFSSKHILNIQNFMLQKHMPDDLRNSFWYKLSNADKDHVYDFLKGNTLIVQSVQEGISAFTDEI